MLYVKIPRPINYLFKNSIEDRLQARFLNMKFLIQVSDQVCIDNVRWTEIALTIYAVCLGYWMVKRKSKYGYR